MTMRAGLLASVLTVACCRLWRLHRALRVPGRRRLLTATAGLGGWALLALAAAATDELAASVAAFAVGAKVNPGKVRLDIAELVDNGNVVPITATESGTLALTWEGDNGFTQTENINLAVTA